MSAKSKAPEQAISDASAAPYEVLKSRLIMVENECSELHRLLTQILTQAETLPSEAAQV